MICPGYVGMKKSTWIKYGSGFQKLVVNAAETAGITGFFQVGISDDELELVPILGRKG